jgi:hypothetical protein
MIPPVFQVNVLSMDGTEKPRKLKEIGGAFASTLESRPLIEVELTLLTATSQLILDTCKSSNSRRNLNT